MVSEPKIVIDGLGFPEGLRWRDGRLYFSDFPAQQVTALGPDGGREVVAEVPGQPSGQGWLPDGTHVIVSMHDNKVVKADGGEVADLSGFGSHSLNDMLVSSTGVIYTGELPVVDQDRDPPIEPSVLFAVDPATGEAEVAAEGLSLANGIAESADGRTLIVAETFGSRLSAFDVGPSGKLSGRRIWAELPCLPDGICLDAEGCVWAAAVLPEDAAGAIRVREGGEIVERIESDRPTVDVVLGGPDGRTLFMAEVLDLSDPGGSKPGNGRIRAAEVGTPAAS